jgi:hypothetical protein
MNLPIQGLKVQGGIKAKLPNQLEKNRTQARSPAKEAFPVVLRHSNKNEEGHLEPPKR